MSSTRVGGSSEVCAAGRISCAVVSMQGHRPVACMTSGRIKLFQVPLWLARRYRAIAAACKQVCSAAGMGHGQPADVADAHAQDNVRSANTEKGNDDDEAGNFFSTFRIVQVAVGVQKSQTVGRRSEHGQTINCHLLALTY